MFTTFIILSAMVAVFFIGRYSILMKVEQFAQERAKEVALKVLEELSPTELTINLFTSEVKFDKDPYNPVTVKFTGHEEIADSLMKKLDENGELTEDLKSELESFKKSL